MTWSGRDGLRGAGWSARVRWPARGGMACAGSDPTNHAPPGASSHSALLTRRQRLTGLAKIAVALHVSCDIIAVGPYRMVFFALPPLKICGQPNFG